ncbi:hypothetical protein GCM10009804_62760 [Kribbella hippodromi]|uniref:Carboxylic ester hydrolase n=1 Tax=Kribbella hippodromi TaxID=434347 RepID=A0ABP4Q3F2_9ACTN
MTTRRALPPRLVTPRMRTPRVITSRLLAPRLVALVATAGLLATTAAPPSQASAPSAAPQPSDTPQSAGATLPAGVTAPSGAAPTTGGGWQYPASGVGDVEPAGAGELHAAGAGEQHAAGAGGEQAGVGGERHRVGPRVRVLEGVLGGVGDSGSVRFLGVPYAQARRWGLPERAASWRGVRAATAPGAVCEQEPKMLEPGAKASEDCLFLNVTAPRRQSSKPRPVIVYLHGGGFVQGSGSYLDAGRMAVLGDAVVVTPNYRLGIFGNLALPGMPEVNLGLRDQLAALRWVRANIRAFGGDPANVTLSGESAGGLSTCTLLASPAAAGLFAKAIISSGSCTTSYAAYSIDSQIPVEVSTWYDRATTDAMGTAAAQSLGCTDARTALACLRRLPADRLVPLTSQFGLLSTGTPTVPRAPRTQLRAAWARNVPVLAGNTADEHLGWIFPAYPNATAATYRQVIRSGFGNQAAAVERQYPLNRYQSPIVALGHIYTDLNWICPTVEAQKVYARTAPTWTFLFADPAAPTIDGTKVPRPSTPHGSDVAYTFPDPAIPLTRAQRALGDLFIRAWTTFARTGVAAWPRTGARQFAPRDGQVDLDTTHHCGFWRTLHQAAAGS